MKRNLLITTLLLIFMINMIPIQSNAAAEFSPINTFDLPALQSADSNITWTLGSKVGKTRSISCSKGSTIDLTCVSSSSSASVELGIIEPDGTYHTTLLKKLGVFSYEVPSTGTYKIYCKNSSTSSVAVSITYQIY